MTVSASSFSLSTYCLSFLLLQSLELPGALLWLRATFKNPIYKVWIDIAITYKVILFIIRRRSAREIKCFHLIHIFPFIITKCPTGLINRNCFNSNIVRLCKYNNNKLHSSCAIHTNLKWAVHIWGKNGSWLLHYSAAHGVSPCPIHCFWKRVFARGVGTTHFSDLTHFINGNLSYSVVCKSSWTHPNSTSERRN